MADYKPDVRAPARLGRRRESVFAYSLWVHWIDLVRRTVGRAARPVEVPTHQWMDAVGRRRLTPAELAARRKYFDRKAAEAIARCAG